MEPGSHSGLSLDGDVGESTGGSFPGAVVSGFAVESAPSAAIDVSPTSLSASSIPAPPNPITTTPSETQLLSRVTQLSPSGRFRRLAFPYGWISTAASAWLSPPITLRLAGRTRAGHPPRWRC